ncbi:MAG: hypothetical protein FWG98_09570 [Candidatus Cloacimonetes bacterium]|nr:hypothetical protein [Candidatus Cloacimonadota bacterium]
MLRRERRERSKLYRKVKFNKAIGIVLASIMMLALLGLVIGCSNPITKVETFDSPTAQMQSVSNTIYWFVESFDNGNTRSDPIQLLLQYLQEKGDKLNIEELELFIAENIGDIEIIIDREEAEENEIILFGRIKEKVCIDLPDGTQLIIYTYN